MIDVPSHLRFDRKDGVNMMFLCGEMLLLLLSCSMEPRLAGSAGWLAGCLLRYYRAGEQRWDTDGGGGGVKNIANHGNGELVWTWPGEPGEPGWTGWRNRMSDECPDGDVKPREPGLRYEDLDWPQP